MAVDWEKIRTEEFPATARNVQLKAAGGSPLSKCAYKSARVYFDEMLCHGDAFWTENLKKVEDVRSKVTEYLNAKMDEVAFIVNSSSCMAVALHYLDQGEILYPAQEFPVSVHAVQRAGLRLHPIRPVDNRFTLEAMESEVNDQTSTLITSHVQYLTGFRQNLEDTGRLCRKRNIRHVVNATQSFGTFPIDVAECGVDLLVASGLKWACAGYGIGILYAQEDLIEDQEMPNLTGWLSVEDPFKMDPLNVRVRKSARAFDALGGAPHFPQIFALGGSMSLLERIGNGNLREGVRRVSSRILELSDYLAERLEGLNLNIISPLEEEHRSGITTIETPKAERITQILEEKGILVSCRGNPQTGERTFVRISLHFYNNTSDIDALIEELGKLRHDLS